MRFFSTFIFPYNLHEFIYMKLPSSSLWHLIICGLISCILFSTTACESSGKSTKNEDSDSTSSRTRKVGAREALIAEPFAYDLGNPTWEVDLPSDLREISGLAHVGEGELAMVQDEQGLIFIFDLESKEITARHRFRNKGDFEGVEILGETAYVLRSDGDVYEILNYRSETPIVESYETALSTRNDTEGLGYDPVTKLLLISSKESDKLMGTKYKDKQVVVSFDPETKSLRPNPFVVIDLDDIKAFLKKNAKTKSEKKFEDKFDPDKNSSFRPSGIAVHPITQEIYLIASNGNMLLVLNRQFQILQAKRLPSKKFPQPEGLCFDPEGNMYISNEGNLDAGNLKKFAMQK